MNKAIVKIQRDYGDYTNKTYTFWTDIEDLKAGDIVMVLTQYGIQLALFVEYDKSKFEPNNILLFKISGPKITIRKKEVKDKLVNSKLKEMNNFLAKIYEI